MASYIQWNPTRRLTELLSGYLEFDRNQLQLGLWRGNLEIQNVQLKNDAFYPIFNSWKTQQEKDHENKGSSGCKRGPNNISSFLSKDLLLSDNPSPSSHLDVKLVNGSIDLIRAVVPWKTILIGSRGAKVAVELQGVTIRLKLESCVAKALREDSGGLYGVCKNKSNNSDFNEYMKSEEGGSFNDGSNNSSPKYREWKQSSIKSAERNLKNKEDIPAATSFCRSESDTTDESVEGGKDSDTTVDVDADADTIEAASSTFIERFVRSFASNVGWRVGKSLQVKVQNLKIVLIQGDVEIGLINKSIEIYEFGTEATYNSIQEELVEIDNRSKRRKENYEDDFPISDPNATKVIQQSATSGDQLTIKKSIKMLGSGIFIRSSNIPDPQKLPTLDEYLLHPTDITVTMLLRRDGPVANITFEKETRSNNNDEDSKTGSPSEHSNDAFDKQEAAGEVTKNENLGKRKRRGKRDKNDISNLPPEVLPRNESFHAEKFDYEHIDRVHKEVDCGPMTLPHSSDDSVLPEFSTHIVLHSIVVVFSTYNCVLLNKLSSSIGTLVIGRPDQLIPSRPMESEDSSISFRLKPQSEKNKATIRQWWYYIIFNVLKDLRTKRYLVEEMKKGSKQFDWSLHQQLKTEYVSLFLRLRLNRNLDNNSTSFNLACNLDDEQRLLALEDRLNTEQILLFRSFARSIGERDMPSITLPNGLYSSSFLPSNDIQQSNTLPVILSRSDVDEDLMLKNGPVSFDDRENIRGAPKKQVHRRHRSLFTMENTQPEKGRGHKRGKTTTFESTREIVQLKNNHSYATESADAVSMTSDFILPKDQQKLPLAPVEEEGERISEEILQPAFQGSISSLVTISMKSMSLFVCDTIESNIVSDNDRDDISILTSNTTDGFLEKVPIIDKKTQDFLISQGRNSTIISIFGKPHEMLLCSSIHQIKVHSEVSEQRKLYVIGVEGICCQLLDNNFVSSGILKSLNKPAYSSNTFAPMHTVDYLSQYAFYVKDDTQKSFFSGELLTGNLDTDDVSNSHGEKELLCVQSLISKVHVRLGTLSVTKGFRFLSKAGFLNNPQYSFPESNFDCLRRQQLRQNRNKPVLCAVSKKIDLFCELYGVELSVLIPTVQSTDSFEQQQFDPQEIDFIQTQESLLLELGRVAFRRGKFFKSKFEKTEDGSTAVNSCMKSVPSRCVDSVLCTVSRVKVRIGSMIVVDELHNVEILFSLAPTMTNVNMTVHLTPVVVMVSKHRVQSILELLRYIDSLINTQNTWRETDSPNVIARPRLAELADLSITKMRVICPAFEIIFFDDSNQKIFEEPKTHLRKNLRETLSMYLYQRIGFQQTAGTHVSEAQRALVQVTCNRIRGLGFSDSTAKDVVQNLNVKGIRNENMTGNHLFGSQGTTQSFDNDASIALTIEDAIESLLEGHKVSNCFKGNPKLSLSFGFRLYLEQLFYDWRMSLNLDNATINASNRLDLVIVSPSNASSESTRTVDGQFIDDYLLGRESALSINIVKKEAGYSFGEGGAPTSIYANDELIEKAAKNKTQENEIFYTIGKMEVFFVDEEVLKAVDLISDTFCDRSPEEEDHDAGQYHSPTLASVSTGISGSISDCRVLFFTNQFQPFLKVSLGISTVDLASNQNLLDEGTSFLVTAGSKSVNIIDLSVDGQKFDHVISAGNVCLNDIEKNNDPLHLKMAIPSDSKRFPSELLVILSDAKLLVLRRFINELIQYFLTQDYGIGRIMAQPENEENGEPPHQLNFQVHINNSSAILPKNSESDDLIALTISKLVLSNSLEEESWPNPSLYKQNYFSTSKMKLNESINNFFDTVDSKDESISEDQCFDESRIFRISVTAAEVDIFTGISREMFIKEDELSAKMNLMNHFLDLGEVADGGLIFVHTHESSPDNEECDKILNDLTKRRWEKVTLKPIFLQLLSDFLPSHMRILIKDIDPNVHEAIPIYSEVNAFCFDLRMSQFYTILSTWYENMQELPVLFPYSAESIHSQVKIPTFPPDWPDYGSAEYAKRISTLNRITCEIALSFNELEWKCSFDVPQYYQKKMNSTFMLDSIEDGIRLHFKNIMFQVDMDSDAVMRTSLGATSCTIYDERCSKTVFHRAFEIPQPKSENIRGSINMAWGLGCGRNISPEDLDFPFQLSVFMTPDRWCLVNLAMEGLDSCTSDLAFLWILLEYFSSYYVDSLFGNPFYTMKEKSENFLRSVLNIQGDNDEEDCLNLDFRLWLLKPRLVILSDPTDILTSAFAIKSVDHSLFYRYKTIGYDYVSQEISCHSLDMMRLENCDKLFRTNIRDIFSSEKWITMLVRSLNMVISYDHNTKSNHTDVLLNITPNDEFRNTDGIELSPIIIEPVELPTPRVCKPSLTPSHHLGPVACEIDLMDPEHFAMASESLLKFAGPYDQEQSSDSGPSNETQGDDSASSFSVFVNTRGLKVFISDPLLGVHFPIIVVNVPDLKVTCSQLEFMKKYVGTSHPTDLQACIDAHLWVDYYKSGPTRTWEPLVEPYKCLVLFEKSFRRGSGITVTSECPLHFNMSGAFFETLASAARSFTPYILGLLGMNDPKDSVTKPLKRGNSRELHSAEQISHLCESFPYSGTSVEIRHEQVSTLSSSEPAVFSLINLTGEEIRFHQQNDSGKYLNYLQHKCAAALAFPATRSLVMNLKIIEVPVYKNGEQIINEAASGRFDASNFIDLQVPGFYWSRGISVDVTGKRFVSLRPKLSSLEAKISEDWRLANAFSMLTDVSFYDGGRQVTVTSCYEIINRTNHSIQLASHHDPMFISRGNCRTSNQLLSNEESGDSKINDCNLETINPGETVQVPILLLEASLQEIGKKLGSFWLRPFEQDEANFIRSLDIRGLKADNASIGFCSSPIQLIHLVDDSAEMFKESGGHILGSESFSSGYQLSCPIVEKEEESISPFCYCIEVRRSPLVSPFPGHNVYGTSDRSSQRKKEAQFFKESNGHSSDSFDQKYEDTSNKSVQSNKNGREGKRRSNSIRSSDNIHGPVAYSLEIHPPIVIENLLPEKGCFELMHATRKQVVWSSELMPGESVPVYTIGLDAPLLLLMNLGYCRTPVGEGALVHQGSTASKRTNYVYDENPSSALNADKLINVFSRLHATQRERAGQVLGQFYDSDEIGRKVVNNKRIEEEKLGSPTKRVRAEGDQAFHTIFTFDDIATETTVVDHLGQKLNLYIENKLGGGGQRHITIYCPYWIVNTTEHALRYKQEKVTSYVSGTVLNESQDGSRVVDLRDSAVKRISNVETIFPGKPGALAQHNLSLHEFAYLMEKEIPLHRIASMALMFNFRDFLGIGGYERRLSFQLADPTGGSKFCSEWSEGVSLESVGVSQTISMHCLDGRHLEVALTTRVAPGKLSHYTKIVRLSPKYVLVNQLERPIRLWQDSSSIHPSRTQDGSRHPTSSREPSNWKERLKDKRSNEDIRKYDFLFGKVAQLDYRRGTRMRPGTVAERSALYITTAGKGEMIPFHLPDTKFERELRIDLGRKWNLTASFPSDIICDYTFKLTPVVDLRILPHVDNRASARYNVQLPPQDESERAQDKWDGELGLWFETVQWSHGTKIVVKGTKRGKYSINNTDIHVGDELVQIDGKLVSEMSFVDTMKLLKSRLAEVLEIYRSNRLQLIQNPNKIATGRPKRPKFLKRFDRSTSAPNQASPITTEDDSDDAKCNETLTLVFQTLEHRMKKLRDKALHRRYVSTRMRGNTITSNRSRLDSGHHRETTRTNNESTSLSRPISNRYSNDDEKNLSREKGNGRLQVSMKHLNQSIFVFVHNVNISSPYRIENRSLDHVIYFRQRGCEHHQWNSLLPGDSVDYTWEEPMKAHKLTVRAAVKYKKSSKEKTRTVKRVNPFNLIESEDHAGFGAPITVKLDMIGFVDSLPCPVKSGLDAYNEMCLSYLYCHISAEGKTKKLVISDKQNCTVSDDEINLLSSHLKNLEKQVEEEKKKKEALDKMKDLPLPQYTSTVDRENIDNNDTKVSALPTLKEDEIVLDSLEGDSLNYKEKAHLLDNFEKAIVDKADNPDESSITKRHQVLVEVVEASGLRNPSSDSPRHPCSPYCTVRVIRRSRKYRHNIFASKSDSSNVKRTYFIDKTDSPKWSGMKFIFDVSPEAESDPQGYAILIKVKDFRLIGKNGSLGMTEIRLRNLRHQKEVFGWYPIMARTGRGSEILAAGAGRGRGSLKVRVQWIYSVSSLLNYYLILSENRLTELETNIEGMEAQLKSLEEAKKFEDEMAGILLKSGMPLVNSNPKRLLKTSANRSASKPSNNRTRNRTKMILKKSSIGKALSPMRTSSEDKKLNFVAHECISRDGDESTCLSMETNDLPLASREDRFYSEGKLRTENTSRKHLPASVLSMKSWHQAFELLNHPILQQIYFTDRGVGTSTVYSGAKKSKTTEKKKQSLLSLILPSHAPQIMQTRKEEFLKMLISSRDNFEKAGSRSLKAVSNAGGCLRIRPITALYLPTQNYTGIHVKLRYGSESVVSRTVSNSVNPEWSSLSSVYDPDVNNDESGKHQQKKKKTEQLKTKNSLKSSNYILNENYQEDFSYFSSDENDLEVSVEALKTSGSLRLSVVGVKVNSKEELGVLHIPLGDAICCCTEKFDDDDDNSPRNAYVRWFPLTDPKWTDPVDIDVYGSHRFTLTEEKHSTSFAQNYTRCIQLAMWWVPEGENDPDYSKSRDHSVDDDNPKSSKSKDHSVVDGGRNFTEKYFNANVHGVSAAIIDSFRARELLSLAFTNIDVRVMATKPKTWLGLAMGGIQIDHHDEDALEPVILSPTPVMHPRPTIQFWAEKDNIKSKSNIDSFSQIQINLEELDLHIEESWMFDLWAMYSRLQKKLQAMQKSATRRTVGRARNTHTLGLNEGFAADHSMSQQSNDLIEAFIQTKRDKDDLEAEARASKKIYIDELMLGFVKVNISYIKKSYRNNRSYDNSKKKGMYLHRRAEIFRRWSELGYDEDWTAHDTRKSRNIPDIISAIFPAISSAPVRVSGKALYNVFETWSELVVTLKNYYVKEMLLQFYKIIGSLDVVGNPTQVVSSVVKGARDFVVMPLREFMRSPQNPSRLGIGVAKGTLSLFSHFFSGIFGLISNLSESAGSGVAALSLDEYFKRWHAQQVARHVQHRNQTGKFQSHGLQIIGYAAARPVQDILAGVLFGLSGIIVEPYEGARTKGAPGFAKGIGVGTVGLVTKPLVGICDAFAHISETINDAARSVIFFDKKFKPVTRRRYPYSFGCKNILLPYNAVNAHSVNLLQMYPIDVDIVMDKRGSDPWDEILVISELLLLNPGIATYIVVTTRRIVLFEVYTAAPPKKLWQIEFSEDVEIKSSVENYRHSGYILRINCSPVNSEPLPNIKENEGIDDGKSSSALEMEPDEFRVLSEHERDRLSRLEEKKFKKLYEQAGALLPNVAFSSRSGTRNPIYADVTGEFANKKEFTKVHNAICCLTRQFDLILHGTGNNADLQGRTSFGNMHFVEELSEKSSKNDVSKDNPSELCLELIPWAHFEVPKDAMNDITVLRRKWNYSDELKVSKCKGGPSWVIESRARTSFIPMPFPLLPPPLTFQKSPELLTLKEKLSKGEISLEDAEESIVETNRLVLEKETFSSAAEFPSMKRESNNIFFSIYEGADEQNQSLFMEGSGDNDEGSAVDNQTVLEQRLGHVEHMLQALMNQISGPVGSFHQHPQTSLLRAAPPIRSSLVTSGTSMISALSNSSDHASGVQQNDTGDKDELIKQIEDLKRQLEIANQTKNSLNDAGESESTSTAMIRSKKKRKRKLKKPWT